MSRKPKLSSRRPSTRWMWAVGLLLLPLPTPPSPPPLLLSNLPPPWLPRISVRVQLPTLGLALWPGPAPPTGPPAWPGLAPCPGRDLPSVTRHHHHVLLPEEEKQNKQTNTSPPQSTSISGTLPWHTNSHHVMFPLCLDIMMSWCNSAMMSWWLDAKLSWFHHFLGLWYHCVVILFCHGVILSRFEGFIMSWFSGVMCHVVLRKTLPSWLAETETNWGLADCLCNTLTDFKPQGQDKDDFQMYLSETYILIFMTFSICDKAISIFDNLKLWRCIVWQILCGTL